MRRLQLRLLGLPGHFYDLPATTTYHLLRLTTSAARRDHMPERTDPVPLFGSCRPGCQTPLNRQTRPQKGDHTRPT